MTRRIAILRARDDAERSAARLSAIGFDCALAPVLQPVALQAAIPAGYFDATLVTSARALEFASDAVLASVNSTPLFAVGERAAKTATARGFALGAPPAPDAVALAILLKGHLPVGSRSLYLAGRDRKHDLEDALAGSGQLVETLEVYEAVARECWSPQEIAALLSCDAALHYSRRSAEIGLALAQTAGIADFWRNLVHVCISEDATAPLRAFGAARVFAARLPREDALIDALVAVSET